MSNPATSQGKGFTERDAETALARIAKEKGIDRARLIERMMRNETAHFTSAQYIATGTGGMEDSAGWKKVIKPYLPNGYDVVYFKDNHPAQRGKATPVPFIVWPSVYQFCLFLSDYIDRNKGNWARWNSTDAKRQAEYRNRIAAIKSRFSFLVDAVSEGAHKAIDEVQAHPGTSTGIVLSIAAATLFFSSVATINLIHFLTQ